MASLGCQTLQKHRENGCFRLIADFAAEHDGDVGDHCNSDHASSSSASR